MRTIRYSYDSSSSSPVRHKGVTYDIPAVKIEYEVNPGTYVALTKDERKRFERFLGHQGIIVTHLYGNFVRAYVKPEMVYERCKLKPIEFPLLDNMCQIALNESYDQVRSKRNQK